MKTSTSLLLVGVLSVATANAQEQWVIQPDTTYAMRFLGETVAYRDWDTAQVFPNERVKNENLGYHHKDDWYLHKTEVPGALPNGMDPALQTVAATHANTHGLDLTQNGQGNTSVSPSDNCLDVGPNHVIQMINGSSGARFQIFNKTGTSLGAAVYLDTYLGSAGGLGDPVVLYDAMADRWLMSEFAASGNHLIVAISTTPDPTGTWYAYDYTTTDFPDYPKYSVWNNSYVVTTNESSPAIYVLPRASMLTGSAGTVVRFTVAAYGVIGFQAVTPVTFDAGTAPPAGALPMFMRMADDAWGAPADRLELWTVNYNAVTPASSTITGPTLLNTSAFDTGLCGYTSFSCIDQPGSTTNLDPLREVLMNRIQYRNFGTHESIVCNHVTDVSGADRAGVRWYELRRTGGSGNPWSIYQQGTYSPDANSRWMGAIAIDGNGDIGLAYNVAGITGGNVYPSVRYTGRYATDPLGTMTIAETSIVAGTTASNSNRYGDYNSLDSDPSNSASFWGTAQHNPAAGWSTRIFAFSIPPNAISVSPKLFLEGPYAAGSMSDALRAASLVPATEPYTAAGYSYIGTGATTVAPAVLAVTGTNAIVDWVVVELRSSANSATIVASKPALVQKDGDVVGVDGVTPVSFALAAGSYYVSVRHRNHLGVMTNATVALSSAPTTVDYTLPGTLVYGTDARKDVAGVQVLWAGDVTFNHQLKYSGSGNDRDPILSTIGGTVLTNTLTGQYLREDVNMDGTVKYSGSVNDKDRILENIGGTVPTTTRSEQLP